MLNAIKASGPRLKEFGMNFICMNNDGFDGLRRPRHILMQLLARRGAKVLFVSTPLDYFTQRKRKKVLKWGGVKKIEPNLYWLQPLAIFRNYYCFWINELSAFFRLLMIWIVSRTIGQKHPVLFITVPCPEFLWMAQLVKDAVVVYNIHDRYLDQNDNWIPRHTDLLRRADIVLCSSMYIYEEIKVERSDNVHKFYPAVDSIFLSEPLTSLKVNSDDRRYVIGFVGNMGNQIDWNLLDQLTDDDHYDYIFVGPIIPGIADGKVFQRLRSKSNVRFLGEIQHDAIPKLINTFDVAILPFGQDEFTKGVNPLKMLEYLALGKPVVGTPIPAMIEFQELFYGASTLEEWRYSLSLAIKENSQEKVNARRNRVASESYERRLDYMLELISGHLEKRYLA